MIKLGSGKLVEVDWTLERHSPSTRERHQNMSSRRSTTSSGSGSSSSKSAKRPGRISVSCLPVPSSPPKELQLNCLQSSTKRLIESLERHQVNTLTELCHRTNRRILHRRGRSQGVPRPHDRRLGTLRQQQPAPHRTARPHEELPNQRRHHTRGVGSRDERPAE